MTSWKPQNMQKLDDRVKAFYLENPECLALRKFMGVEFIEDQLAKFHTEHLTKEVMKRYQKLWDVAESYWIFPDEEDYKKLIDKCYEEMQ